MKPQSLTEDRQGSVAQVVIDKSFEHSDIIWKHNYWDFKVRFLTPRLCEVIESSHAIYPVGELIYGFSVHSFKMVKS